jgi:hypothetical protein
MKLAASLHSLSGLLVITALAAAGCGGSDDSACVSAGKAICAAACICGGADGCAIGDTSGGITFNDEGDCRSLYTFGCSQDDGSVDFDACKSALASPMCVQSSDGRVLDLPAACDVAAD